MINSGHVIPAEPSIPELKTNVILRELGETTPIKTSRVFSVSLFFYFKLFVSVGTPQRQTIPGLI